MRQTAQTLLSNFYTMYGFLTAMAIVADAKKFGNFSAHAPYPLKNWSRYGGENTRSHLFSRRRTCFTQHCEYSEVLRLYSLSSIRRRYYMKVTILSNQDFGAVWCRDSSRRSRYCPYSVLLKLCPACSMAASSIQPLLQAISSRQATLSP